MTAKHKIPINKNSMLQTYTTCLKLPRFNVLPRVRHCLMYWRILEAKYLMAFIRVSLESCKCCKLFIQKKKTWSRSGSKMVSPNLLTVYTRLFKISKGIMNAHLVMKFVFNFTSGWATVRFRSGLKVFFLTNWSYTQGC